MKKNKNIKALVFSLIGGLSSLTTLPLAAISCKENLDLVGKKAKLDVSDEYKKEHTAEDFTKEKDIDKVSKLSGIDRSKYEVTFLGVKKVGDDKVEVKIEIKSKKTGNVISATFTISGFKKQTQVDEQKLINEEVEKVKAKYKNANPENVEAKDVKKDDLEFSGYNSEKYDLEASLNASQSANGILQPMVTLKTKDGKYKSTTKVLRLEGFKKNPILEDEQKKINSLINKIEKIDYQDKKNVLTKDANDVSKLTWEFKSGITENKDDYELTNVTFEPNVTDLTKLKVKFYLKNKKNNLISKGYASKTIEGFKKPEITDPEEKKFNDYVNGLTAKYSESTDNLDLNELELNKMKYLDKENKDIDPAYQISEVKWLKEKISKQEWESGKRKFTAKITKGTYSLVKEFEITTHPSDKDVLIDQREKFKENTKLIQEPEVKQLVESMADGDDLYYSYSDYKFYNKKYNKNNPNDPTRKAIFELKNHQAVFGTSMAFAKLVKKGNKISLKFKLRKYVKGQQTINDIKEFSTPEEEFDIYDQNRLNELADQNKDKFDYKNKENTKLIDIKENNIVKPSVPRCDVVISKVEKDSVNNQLKVTYKLVYGSIVSKEVETTIKGFKEDALNSLLDGVTLEYENKENVLGTEANTDKFKLMKNNTEYNIPSDVTVKKEIIYVNKYKNIVKVKVTLTKGTETTYVEYEVSGFKKEAFNLDDFNNKLQFKYQGDIANTEASSVQYSQFKTENDGYPLDCAEIKDVKLEKNVEEGKVTIKYKLKDLCNDGNPEKEYSKEITGFKKAVVKNYRSKAVYDASVAGKLFTVDNNKISELREALGKLNTLVALKSGKVWTSNGKNGKAIPGISVHKEAISHGNVTATVAKFEKWGKNTKGINIVKENGNYVAKWRLVLANGDIDKQEYSQVLCPIN